MSGFGSDAAGPSRSLNLTAALESRPAGLPCRTTILPPSAQAFELPRKAA